MESAVMVRVSDGKIIPQIVLPNPSSVLDLKEQIKKTINLDVVRQTLKFNNEEMMDDQLLADYHHHAIQVDPSSVVMLVDVEVTPLPEGQEFNIAVAYDDQVANVKVKETTTVAELKAKIESIWGLTVMHPVLSCESLAMNQDTAALSEYYLCEGSQVKVSHLD